MWDHGQRMKFQHAQSQTKGLQLCLSQCDSMKNKQTVEGETSMRYGQWQRNWKEQGDWHGDWAVEFYFEIICFRNHEMILSINSSYVLQRHPWQLNTKRMVWEARMQRGKLRRQLSTKWVRFQIRALRLYQKLPTFLVKQIILSICRHHKLYFLHV